MAAINQVHPQTNRMDDGSKIQYTSIMIDTTGNKWGFEKFRQISEFNLTVDSSEIVTIRPTYCVRLLTAGPAHLEWLRMRFYF